MNREQLYNKVADQKRLDFIIGNIISTTSKGGYVLDVGCGNGIISMSLGRLGYQVRGIDVSEKTIATAQQNNTLKNVTFEAIDAANLELPISAYDSIVCSEVLEHLDQPSALLKELYQALKNNGKLLVTVPNGWGPREMLVTRPILALRKQNGWAWRSVSRTKRMLGYNGKTIQSAADNLDHVQFFSKKDLENLSKSNQFTIVKFQNANFIEDVFPVSLLSKRVKAIQQLDCKVADWLPHRCTGGFLTVWEKSPK